MQYTYEFELWRGEREWCIAPFVLGGATQGATIKEACESAADLLRELVQDYLMHGETPPADSFDNAPCNGGVRVIVSVDTSLADVERISAAEAAAQLGVSRSRISAMINTGLLDGWREGRNTWVTTASVEARKQQPVSAGRPRKEALA